MDAEKRNLLYIRSKKRKIIKIIKISQNEEKKKIERRNISLSLFQRFKKKKNLSFNKTPIYIYFLPTFTIQPLEIGQHEAASFEPARKQSDRHTYGPSISSKRLLDQDQIDSWIVTAIGIESSRSRVRGRCICSRAREQLSGWPCYAHATIIKSRPIRSCRFATDKGLKYRRGDDLSAEIRSSPRFFPPLLTGGGERGDVSRAGRDITM